jgi:hypothetical protein
MHWVIQDNLYKERGIEEMIETLDRLDIPYSLVKVVPFVGDMEPPLEDLTGPIICFGSYGMRHHAKRMGWKPGVFDLDAVGYDVQKEIFGDAMLNSDLVICDFKHVPALMPSDPVFIRPVADSKDFAGGIMDRDNIEEWVRMVCVIGEDFGDKLEPTTKVMMSSVKNIVQEARFWIVDGTVVTQSYYKFGNIVRYSNNVDQDLIREAGRLVCNHPMTIRRDINGKTLPNPLDRLPQAYVLDLARLENGDIKIVELNTINAAGLYDADVNKLVGAIESLRV